VVRQVQTNEIRNGLEVQFVLGTQPSAGAQLETTWYYNNKPLGDALKKRGTTVATSLRSSGALPPGFWRCTLRIKLPHGDWKEVQEARLRLLR
jgi:hypothetical protein